MSHPFDEPLRDVPLPDGFVERLKASLVREIVPQDDDALDQLVRAVPVPESLLLRLHEIPGDEQLDEQLAAVDPSPALIYSLRRPTWRQRVRRVERQLAGLARAAVWLVAVTAALASGVGAVVSGVMPAPPPDYGMVVIHEGPFRLTSQPQSAEPQITLRPQQASEDEVYLTALVGPPMFPVARDWSDDPITLIAQPESEPPLPPPGPVGQWTELVAQGLRPLDDAVLMRYGVLGSPQYVDDRLPEMRPPALPRPMGIEPPLARGYDRPFFLKNRLFPPITPAADPRLSRLSVPLIPASDVLGRLERQLAEGTLPTAADVRVEDFIAAMDYRLAAAPDGRLALRTSAGPSLFGGPHAELIFVGVQAGGFAKRPQPATHLTLAIDLSHSMGTGGRLEALQTAVERLLAQLGDRDRLSLVVFQDQVLHVIEEATLADRESLRAWLKNLAPRGGTNLAAGLQQGAALAMSGASASEIARRLVLITDSQARLSSRERDGVQQVLAAAAESGVRLDVLDLSQRQKPDPLLARWAVDLSGKVHAIDNPNELARQLLAALAGGDAFVARRARLTLHFSPQNVAAYRLIGHEANALADVVPVEIETDLAAGEAAAALVELWLQGDGDDLGHAELTWTDPMSGKQQRLRQRISRVQFAATLDEAPLPLVQAALAAQVGEVLRGAPAVLRQADMRSGAASDGLAGVAAMARRTNPLVSERADVQRLLKLVEELRAQGLR